ncbi:MAG: YraN family protein [Clostridiales Family XIII bacterium]|jgi:putative endonuclease|nr:YraN family protein [Clostridiales Family XIII bacterium]
MESVEMVRKEDSLDGSRTKARGVRVENAGGYRYDGNEGGVNNGDGDKGGRRGGSAAPRAPKPFIERAGRRMNIGRRGEELAVAFLENSGYRILQRNFTCRHGEIDVIAWPRGVNTLCFIEVKCRGNENMGRPHESVGSRKRKHYRQAATIFLMREWDNLGVDAMTEFRFDVMEVVLGGGKPEINHIRSAFI